MMYIGVVEDRYDPEEMGRVRVRVAGVHSESITEIPRESLPWATVMTPTTSSSISEVMHTPYLVEGTWVVLFFTDQYKQNPVIVGTLPSKPVEVRVGDVGFKDPSNTYPRYLNESDTPFEARAKRFEQSSTYETKLWQRHEEIPTASRPKIESVSEPREDAEYEDYVWSEFTIMNDHVPRYPFNQVRKTEAGITEEFDNTPGNVRMGWFHPSGTYEEVYQDGSRALHVEGQQKVYIGNGCDVFIEGNANLTVDGNMRHLVKGDYKLEVDGDYTRLIHGNMQTKVGMNDEREILSNRSVNITENDKLSVGKNKTTSVGINFTQTTGEDYFRTTGADDINIVHGKLIEQVTGNYAQTNIGTLTITSKGNIRLETPSNYAETITGTQSSNVTGAVTETYGSTQNTTAGGDITIVGGPNINLNP